MPRPVVEPSASGGPGDGSSIEMQKVPAELKTASTPQGSQAPEVVADPAPEDDGEEKPFFLGASREHLFATSTLFLIILALLLVGGLGFR